MAKSRKQKPSPTPPTPTNRADSSLLTTLEQPRSQMLFLGLVLLLIIALYKPIVFDGLDSSGSDVIANIGNTHAAKQFEKETGERSLWNPNVFAGMPRYHRINAVSWSIDTLIMAIDPLLDWRIWYLWLGAIGMFLLMRYLGLSLIAGMLGSLAFILLPHSHALIVVGHFSKLRALMWIPYIAIAFMMLLNTRNILSMLLFTAAFALQLRTQHYQIVFYTILLLAFIGFVPYIKMLTEKRTGDFLKFNGLFIASIVLLVMIVAQPLLVTRDYTPYSTRGGQAINIYETVEAKDAKGVGFDYATNWSYTLAEFWNLVIPKFHGGTSDEGIRVPKLNNQQIPAYWGDLPFTQSYEYFGVLIALLALIGIVFYWHSTFVKSLTALTVLALLLSLGKHFAPLYKLFFYYLPFFDKFRVPMMILTLVSFNAIVLAGHGITALITNSWDAQHKKRLYVVMGAFAALIASPLLFGGMLSLSNANEFAQYAQRYGEQQARQLIEIFREARLEVLRASTLRSLFFVLMGIAAFWMMSNREKAQRGIWGLILVALITVDLGWITVNYLDGKFVDLKRIEQQNYRMNQVDRIIKQDKSLHRVLPPLRVMANDSRWPYYHQSIGGYDPAKMQVMQDLIANNILDRENPQMPINLEVVAMLNGKYIVSNQPYEHPKLTYLGEDASQSLYLYRNELALPRAFFVDSVVVLSDGVERLKYLNSAAFDPATIAVLEAPLEQPVQRPDSSSATVTYFSPNKITLDVYASQPGLLVISEIYYPKGWKATLENGEILPIHKTNHALRSVYMPAGQHTLTLTFAPATYYSSIWVSWIGWVITYLGLAFYGWRYYRKEGDA
jgi:hypothetical protein